MKNNENAYTVIRWTGRRNRIKWAIGGWIKGRMHGWIMDGWTGENMIATFIFFLYLLQHEFRQFVSQGSYYISIYNLWDLFTFTIPLAISIRVIFFAQLPWTTMVSVALLLLWTHLLLELRVIKPFGILSPSHLRSPKMISVLIILTSAVLGILLASDCIDFPVYSSHVLILPYSL